MKTKLVLTILFTVVFAFANAVSAAILTYTDRTSWSSDVGGADYTIDFESFAADTSFASTPLDLGPLTLVTLGTAEPGRNIVDVAPFEFSGVPASFGNAAADIFVEDPLAAAIAFDIPVLGFFADFLNAGNTQELTLTLVNGGVTSIQVPGPGDSLQPFGFISTGDAVEAIQMSNSVNDGFYVDNMAARAIPEPSAVVLFGIGTIIASRAIGRRAK